MLLLLGLAAMPASGKKQSSTQKKQTEENTVQIDKTVLEEKLENILSSVEGVGNVQVMLMTDEEKDAQGFYGTGTQKVNGVLICASGADDPVVVHNIQQAVMALFQVEAHKIKVMKMK